MINDRLINKLSSKYEERLRSLHKEDREKSFYHNFIPPEEEIENLDEFTIPDNVSYVPTSKPVPSAPNPTVPKTPSDQVLNTDPLPSINKLLKTRVWTDNEPVPPTIKNTIQYKPLMLGEKEQNLTALIKQLAYEGRLLKGIPNTELRAYHDALEKLQTNESIPYKIKKLRSLDRRIKTQLPIIYEVIGALLDMV
jgi:hypothetical protein